VDMHSTFPRTTSTQMPVFKTHPSPILQHKLAANRRPSSPEIGTQQRKKKQ
jgi:hypothetical protein